MRLRRLESATPAKVCWRSYLLRPRPNTTRTLEKFRAYTSSWMRPAADADGGNFRVWQTDEGPPSHSIPPHLVAKAAAALGDDAFQRMHERLLEAYFFENRDITNDDVLRALWRECDLAAADFDRRDDPATLQTVLREHSEALELGVTGVPAVRAADDTAVITGAHPYQLYERWIARLSEERNH